MVIGNMEENFECRIKEIAKLKKGWNFGKGEAFHEDHVEIACLLSLRYHKKYSLNVTGTPNVDGSIDLTFAIDDEFLDLKIMPNIKDITVVYSHGIGQDKIEEMWGTVDISTLDNIVEKFINLKD